MALLDQVPDTAIEKAEEREELIGILERVMAAVTKLLEERDDKESILLSLSALVEMSRRLIRERPFSPANMEDSPYGVYLTCKKRIQEELSTVGIKITDFHALIAEQ